jgi:hypothetical protein
MPPKVFYQGLRNFILPIAVGQGAPEKSSAVRASKESLPSPLPPMRAEME